MTIDEHLAACMAASNLRPGYAGAAFDEFCDAILASPPLARAVRAAGGASDPQIERRDHIARWRNELLARVIGATHV